MNVPNRSTHIRLTSHPEPNTAATRFPIRWGAVDPKARGPVVGSVTNPADRNVIGAHGGSYSLYRALAIAARALNPLARPDLRNTEPTAAIGPHPQWSQAGRIVSLDPFGHLVGRVFADEIGGGIDIRPTIAVTKARLNLPEILAAMGARRLAADGGILHRTGDIAVTKIAVDPVWHLPGIAARFGVSEGELRRILFEQTSGMFSELVTRPDMNVFLPPIGGTTIYVIGDVAALSDPRTRIACRVHDECNGSDVFGSDICTCRPYLVHGIEECVREAQTGGVGVIAYNRKEGRALGEVTKFLVYNARKRQEGGDSAATYFERTECVAGVQDARFQQLMPDVLHWLGIRRIDRLMSMSNLKYDAIVDSGIEVGERVPLPAGLVPPDAAVEIEAKKAAGYYTPRPQPGPSARSRGAISNGIEGAMIDHLGFDCSDYRRSRAFYERALAPLRLTVVMGVTREESGGYEGCGFGENGKPEFWIGSNEGPGSQPVPRSLHVAFRAKDRATVHAFHEAALAAGGVDNGAPGLRPHYHRNYYAAFVFDPDGHNIETVCHNAK